MTFREAFPEDIQQLQIVRNSVLENRLSDPSVVTNDAVRSYLKDRGKGWVCESDDIVVGFAIADLLDHNVWALFVLPDFEHLGVGQELHGLMMAWYFEQTGFTVWLSTAPGTRAEAFYRKAGWLPVGSTSGGELKFEMTKEIWNRLYPVKIVKV